MNWAAMADMMPATAGEARVATGLSVGQMVELSDGEKYQVVSVDRGFCHVRPDTMKGQPI